MPASNPVDAVLAAGGLSTDAALAELWGISRVAIGNFRRKGYLPLDRAKDALARWPTLKDDPGLRMLVKPEIRDAMDRA